MSSTLRYVRLYTGQDGQARFADVDVPFEEVDAHLGVTARESVSQVFFARSAPGRDRTQSPEPRRQWVVCLAGSVEITASSGESRTFRTGDVLLAEDIEGLGHASSTSDGWTCAVIALVPGT